MWEWCDPPIRKQGAPKHAAAATWVRNYGDTDTHGSGGLGELSVVSTVLLGVLGSVTVGVASAGCMGPDCRAQEGCGAGQGERVLLITEDEIHHACGG